MIHSGLYYLVLKKSLQPFFGNKLMFFSKISQLLSQIPKALCRYLATSALLPNYQYVWSADFTTAQWLLGKTSVIL